MIPPPPRLALALTLAAGCAAADAPSRATVVTDSAGVRIVRSGAPAWSEGEGWTVAAEPSLSIGVAEGAAEYELAGVRTALRFADGRILIANGPAELRWYDAEGRHLRTVGRRGEGPGEFQVLWRVFALPGDSLVAWDVGTRRASVLAADGTPRHTYTVPSVDSLAPEVVGAFPDGTVAALPAEGGEGKWRDQEVVRRDTISVQRIGLDGAPTGTLARIPGKQQIEVWLPPTLVVDPSPFGRTTYLVVRDGFLYVADNERMQVDVYASDGRLVRSTRAPQAPEPVTPADVDAFREAAIDERWRPTYLAAKRRYLEVAPFPETKPAHGGLVVGEDGSLWLEAYGADAAAPRRWRVFHADGHELGTVRTPPELRVTQIGSDFVLGVERDELGVERVRLYALER